MNFSYVHQSLRVTDFFFLEAEGQVLLSPQALGWFLKLRSSKMVYDAHLYS